MSYSSSEFCQQSLCGIEAIDYFFARQMEREFGRHNDALFFHLMLAVQWLLRQGHVCLPLTKIEGKTLWQDIEEKQAGFIFPAADKLLTCLDTLSIGPDDGQAVIYDNGALYLRRYWQFEREVANALFARMSHTRLSRQLLERARPVFEKLFFPASAQTSIVEPDWQQVAVANALGRRLSIISGGPGTGKTYTVTRLLTVLQAVNEGNLRIQMAAPTGKAAQRLKESIASARAELKLRHIEDRILAAIPEQAATLHRLLGFRPHSLKLKYDAENPLRCDLLLIDEASMIDLPMMARVLRALPEKAVLILLGDADQLPSVETGSVLADISCTEHPGYHTDAAGQIELLSGSKVTVNPDSHFSHLTLLTQAHRNAGEIVKIAQEVIDVDVQASWQRLLLFEQKEIHFFHENGKELTYLRDSLFEQWLEQVCQYYFSAIGQAKELPAAFAALAAFRILVPTRVGDRGVEQLNPYIEQLLSRHNYSIRPGLHYRGRPIMITRNSYSSGLFNGDVGLVWPDESGQLVAWFEKENGEFRPVSLARLPLVETVYAMTIHKTQGSEFNHVALVLPQRETAILSPELLYTGLTRAREHLYVITNEKVWKSALAERLQRYSGLGHRLNGLFFK